MPDISVVIVNFNGASFITECLDALFNSQLNYTYEVILVDNASTDQSFDVMAPYLHRMTIIQNTENTGFAFANNQAFAIAKGKYLFLLNTDAVVAPNAIQLMMDEYEKHPEIGAIAPKLLNGDGTLQCPGSSFGHFRFKQNVRREVPFIAGAAVLITKKMMDAMNGMDENLFFYNDDVDMSRYLRLHGHPIVYLPQAEVVHYGGLSTNFRKVGSLIEGYRGGIYLAYKHYGCLVGHMYRFILLIILIPSILDKAIRGIWNQTERTLLGGYLTVFRIALTNDIYLDRVKAKMGVNACKKS